MHFQITLPLTLPICECTQTVELTPRYSVVQQIRQDNARTYINTYTHTYKRKKNNVGARLVGINKGFQEPGASEVGWFGWLAI